MHFIKVHCLLAGQCSGRISIGVNHHHHVHRHRYHHHHISKYLKGCLGLPVSKLRSSGEHILWPVWLSSWPQNIGFDAFSYFIPFFSWIGAFKLPYIRPEAPKLIWLFAPGEMELKGPDHLVTRNAKCSWNSKIRLTSWRRYMIIIVKVQCLLGIAMKVSIGAGVNISFSSG